MTSQTRKERERAAHRLAILEAAEEVFADKGFHNATVQEIADRAEFSVGYLYGLFDGKNALYVELMELRISQYVDEVEGSIPADGDALGRVRAAMSAVVDYLAQHAQLLRIFIRAHDGTSEGPAPGLPKQCMAKYRAYMSRLARIFADGIEQGVFIKADPLLLVQCMDGLTHHGILRYLMEGKHPDKGVGEMLQRILLEGIVAKGAAQ
jgi:AcrR family transcriptional regulator